MTDHIDFAGRVAVVTGAGRGLGAAYALELARRGARVVVNDAGVALDGGGNDQTPAQAVVRAIGAAGGDAIDDRSDITDAAQAQRLVERAQETWGRLDIVICNAGILRDRTFVKKDLADFRAVVDVHLWGTVNVMRHAWPLMLEQQYGRALLTTSISGTLGSFGQADYSAAKAGIMGLMNTLALEGERRGVHVNAISPAAATRMSEGVLPEAAQARLRPELVVPAALYLVSEKAPTKVAIQAGGGRFSRVLFAQTEDVVLGEEATVEDFATHFDRIAADDRLFPVRVPEMA